MRFSKYLLALSAASLFSFVACSDDEGDSGSDSDSATGGTSGDGDISGDGDGTPTGDGDGDGTGDGDGDASGPIVEPTTSYIDPSKSGVPGLGSSVYADMSGDSSITQSVPELGTLCFEGVGAEVKDGDYAKYYGAGAEIALVTETQANATPPEGYDGSDLDKITFDLTGDVIPNLAFFGLADFTNKNGQEKLVYLTNPGSVEGPITLVPEDLQPLPSTGITQADKPIDKTNLVGIQISIATVEGQTTPFRFCISNLQIGGWVQPDPNGGAAGSAGE